MKFYKISYLIPLLLLTLYNCQKKEVFQPVNKSNSTYLKESQEYSKLREDKERKYLQTWINKQQDSLDQKFIATSSGIWLRFIEEKQLPKPKNNDWVKYSAEVKTISGDIIYTSVEFGEKQGFLGKFKEIRGIESALYMMGKGDTAQIVLPSFTAYSLYGDENKIGANVPLLITLNLLDVKSSVKN